MWDPRHVQREWGRKQVLLSCLHMNHISLTLPYYLTPFPTTSCPSPPPHEAAQTLQLETEHQARATQVWKQAVKCEDSGWAGARTTPILQAHTVEWGLITNNFLRGLSILLGSSSVSAATFFLLSVPCYRDPVNSSSLFTNLMLLPKALPFLSHPVPGGREAGRRAFSSKLLSFFI